MNRYLKRLPWSLAMVIGTSVVVLSYGIFPWWYTVGGLALLGVGVYGLAKTK